MNASPAAPPLQLHPDGRLRHLVQLHLSHDCNKPALAKAAGRGAVPAGVRVHTAEQHRAGRVLRLEPAGEPEGVEEMDEAVRVNDP